MVRINVCTLLGANSARYRAALGWSVDVFAQKLGSPTSLVETLEAGYFDATLADLDHLAACLSVNPFALLQESEIYTDMAKQRRSA